MERLKVLNPLVGIVVTLLNKSEKVVAAIDDRPVILYARVSTASQKDDLAERDRVSWQKLS